MVQIYSGIYLIDYFTADGTEGTLPKEKVFVKCFWIFLSSFRSRLPILGMHPSLPMISKLVDDASWLSRSRTEEHRSYMAVKKIVSHILCNDIA